MSPTLLSGIAALFYLAAAGDEVRQFLNHQNNQRRFFVALIAIGLATHWTAAGLAMGVFEPVWSLTIGVMISLSASMVVVALAYLRIRQPVNLALMPLLTLIALVTSGALYLDQGNSGRNIASSGGIALHIVSSVSAFAILFLAGIQSLLLAWQNYALKSRQIIKARLLPPVTRMERMLFDLIGAGWLILTLSLISGWMFVDDLFAQHLAHKTLLSVLAWVVFALLLSGRRLYGWRGFTAAAWTLSGFAILLLGTLGTKIVLEVILDRY
jgi:ABC-type uncharacterized transport system permease subunit